MENIVYIVTDTDDNKRRVTQREFERFVDDLLQDEIALIQKKYKYGGKTYQFTLFTNVEEFGAEEYITHYRALGKQYGHTFLTDFDMVVIRQFSV